MTWENTSYNGAPHSLNMRKEQTSKRQPDRATQDTIRQGKRPHIDTGKGNLIGRKESQEQAEESEINLLPFSLSLLHVGRMNLGRRDLSESWD